MGEYTGIRFTAQLKPGCVDIIKMLNNLGQDERYHSCTWEVVAYNFPHPELKLWWEVPRSTFIPWGAVQYMPDEWGEQMSQLDGAAWQVVCCCKDPRVVELFARGVLPILIDEPCALEVRHSMTGDSTIMMVEPRPFVLTERKKTVVLPKGDDDEV